MTVAACGAGSLSLISGGHRFFTAVFSALMLGCILAANAAAEDAKPAKKIDPLLLEDTIHKLSVASFLQSFSRGGRSVPILVTLSIKGPKGLQSFCELRPRISEAVLNVVTDDQVIGVNRKNRMSDVRAHLLDAVNEALPDAPVSSIDTKTGRSPSEFGKEMIHTSRTCKKLDS